MSFVTLYLEDDISASASTLVESAGLSNDQTNNQDGTGGYWYHRDSYGIDMLSIASLSGMRAWGYNAIWSGNGTVPTGWYGDYYNSFEIWSSDDNSGWTYHETIDSPPITTVKSGKYYIDIELSSDHVNARYLKVRFSDTYNAAFTPGGVTMVPVELEPLVYISTMLCDPKGLSIADYGYNTLIQNLSLAPSGQSHTSSSTLSILLQMYAKAYSLTEGLLTGNMNMATYQEGLSNLYGQLGGSYLLSSSYQGQSYLWGNLGVVRELTTALTGLSLLSSAPIGQLQTIQSSLSGMSITSQATLLFLLQSVMQGKSITSNSILTGIMSLYNQYTGQSIINDISSDLYTHLRSLLKNSFLSQKFNITSINALEIVSVIISNTLDIPYEKILTIINNLGGDPITIARTLLNELSSTNQVQVHQTIINKLESITTGSVIIDTLPESGSYAVSDTISGQDSGTSGTVMVSGEGYIEVETSGLFTPGEAISTGSVDSIIGQIRTYYDQAVIYQPYFDVFFMQDNGKTASIKKRISAMEINYDSDSIHNETEISSTDTALYHTATPSLLVGETRITVQVGIREIYFLLEEKEGNEKSFTLRGRSISALDSSPYKDRFTYAPGHIFNALEYIESSVLSARSVDIVDADLDYLVSDTWEYTGEPTGAAKDLMDRVGGIIRCLDDGSYEIRKSLPYTGNILDQQTADIELTPENDIIEIDFKHTDPSGYNKVLVTGYAPELYLPDIDIEEDDYIQTNTIHLKVYWGAYEPTISDKPLIYMTADGSIRFLSTTIEEKTEDVTFINGVAAVGYPINNISLLEWYGRAPQGYASEKFMPGYIVHDKTITLTSGELNENIATRYALAKIAYFTKYWRYEIKGTDVEKLLAVFQVKTEPQVSAQATIYSALSYVGSEIDVWKDSVEDQILRGNHACQLRAAYELAQNDLETYETTVQIPYRDLLIDGNIFYLNNDQFNFRGNAIITNVTLSFSNGKVDATVTGERKQ